MLFSVLSRGEIELFPNDVHVPYVIISITNPGSRPATLKPNEYTLGILRLSFEDEEDIEKASWDTRRLEAWERHYGPWRPFMRQMAEQIADLVASCEPAAVIVHCEAGISRSAATAAALSKHYNGDDSWVWSAPRYNPNKLVYRVLLDVLRR
jgi:predicted protein tyrosine phosphatase